MFISDSSRGKEKLFLKYYAQTSSASRMQNTAEPRSLKRCIKQIPSDILLINLTSMQLHFGVFCLVSIPGPAVIKLFSCSTQLSMKFFLLINVKMPTVVGISTFVNGKNSIQGLSEPKTSRISRYFYTYEHFKFHAQLS